MKALACWQAAIRLAWQVPPGQLALIDRTPRNKGTHLGSPCVSEPRSYCCGTCLLFWHALLLLVMQNSATTPQHYDDQDCSADEWTSSHLLVQCYCQGALMPSAACVPAVSHVFIRERKRLSCRLRAGNDRCQSCEGSAATGSAGSSQREPRGTCNRVR